MTVFHLTVITITMPREAAHLYLKAQLTALEELQPDPTTMVSGIIVHKEEPIIRVLPFKKE